MQESGIYTQQDLQPFGQRLQVVKAIIKMDKEEGKQYMGVLKLMWRKWEDCGTSRGARHWLDSLQHADANLTW
jgi:hypothetical protein